MKILVVRFSSIGDVVLTTPVVRCLKQHIPNCEIHYITKKAFKGILEHNGNISKIFTIDSSISEVIAALKEEQYDYVIDLHKNLRTFQLKTKLGRPSYSFPKLNFEKWMLVNLKRNKMPKIHIVDRYFKAVEKLGVKIDNKPCDFFIHASDEIRLNDHFQLASEKYITIAIGAQFATKRMPVEKLKEIIEQLNQPIILIGGETDKALANEILVAFPYKSIFSACGNFSLTQSASIVKQSSALLTNDTGMMHIASCFQIPTLSVWGNTVPELGMYPYFPENAELFSIHEVKGMNCRPCSKIGFQECPKGHFNCMNLQDSIAISDDIMNKIG